MTVVARADGVIDFDARVVESIGDQTLIGREHFLGYERFFGGYPQVPLAAAGFQFGH